MNGTFANNQYRNYVNVNSTTQVNYNIYATLPMAILHDFFKKLPILRDMNIRLNINTNTGIKLNFTTTDSGYGALVSSVIPRNTVPFQISQIGKDVNNGVGINNTGGATSMTLCLNIKNNLSTCRFYSCQYERTPEIESIYMSSPEKTVLYDDIQYAITNIPTGGQVNSMLSTGISRLRGILMWGIVNQSKNEIGLNAMQSPSSSAPATTIPYAKVTNFQVQISGRPVFATPLNYNFEHFIEQVRPELSVNGASLKSIGMSSGCITKSIRNWASE